jgi:hypothetical protein
VERSTFEARLKTAAQRAIAFAREYVQQPLPDGVLFRVYPNQSYDGNPRVGDELVFPDESLPEGKFHGSWTIDEALNFLWRGGKVPEWIDIAVEAEDDRHTLVALRCCGRFTGQEDLLYHKPGGLAPFSIKSPTLPPGWQSIEESGRFDLYWREPQIASKWWQFWR